MRPLSREAATRWRGSSGGWRVLQQASTKLFPGYTILIRGEVQYVPQRKERNSFLFLLVGSVHWMAPTREVGWCLHFSGGLMSLRLLTAGSIQCRGWDFLPFYERRSIV